MTVWIGADPGGKGNFGVAVLQDDGSAQTTCVNCADEAFKFVVEQTTSQPAGAGVDAPLWWSSGRSSDRQADQWLRGHYHIAAGTVQTANSLQGAALVQGVMFVQRMRERYPNVPVTESHPKAVLIALELTWPQFQNRFEIAATITDEQEHERDAIIAAVAAREGFGGRWSRDLSLLRHPSEQEPDAYWLAPVHYFWPDE